MSDPASSPLARQSPSVLRRLTALPGLAISGLGEALVSARGLAVGFLLVAAVFTLAGWLRPTLSKDISSVHLPLGIAQTPKQAPEDILRGPRRIPSDSMGVALLAFLALGIAVVVTCPRWFSPVAGLLLALALAGNAVAVFNHPVLIEMLDYEYEQRMQISRALVLTSRNGTVTTKAGNSRVGEEAIPANEQRGDLSRGWDYLLYGRWLVGWAALGTLLGTSGSMGRRLRFLGVWLLVGVGLSAGVCSRRLQAEYYWFQAQRLEGAGRYEASQRALRKAVALLPQLGALERTWLLAGKLDQGQGRSTPGQRFFLAYQFARTKSSAAEEAAPAEDIPWEITRLGVPAAKVDFRTAFPRKERWQALALMEQLRTEVGTNEPAVRNQAARMWTEIGLVYYQHAPSLTDADTGANDYWRDFHLMAAQDAWKKGMEIDPHRRDCPFYLGTVYCRTESDHPELVEKAFTPLLSGLADQVLHAEVMNSLGDAYFEAGQFNEARRKYAKSYDIFCLPKFINFRGQKGLGGL